MKTKKELLFVTGLILLSTVSFGQFLTVEDSLQNGLNPTQKATLIGGYGEAAYHNNLTLENSFVNFNRMVIFVGHKFSKNISFFSEIEIGDAKVDATGGKVELEQTYLKFQLNDYMYLASGLFILRTGILNENHLPNTYFSNHRPFVERNVIPSTWREIGVCLYGEVPSVSGLNYTLSLINGLDASKFSDSKGIKDGRYSGRFASAENIAVNGSITYYVNSFRFQTSAYYGGTVSNSTALSDSVGLESGLFGTPLLLNEANISFSKNGFSAKALATLINISDADKLNLVYKKNCPELMMGWYAEAGYNILRLFNSETSKNFSVFARYESTQLNYKMPSNGIENGANNKTYFSTGFSYFPVKGVVIKTNFTMLESEVPHPVLQPLPYYKKQNFMDIGIGYSF